MASFFCPSSYFSTDNRKIQVFPPLFFFMHVHQPHEALQSLVHFPSLYKPCSNPNHLHPLRVCFTLCPNPAKQLHCFPITTLSHAMFPLTKNWKNLSLLSETLAFLDINPRCPSIWCSCDVQRVCGGLSSSPPPPRNVMPRNASLSDSCPPDGRGFISLALAQ